MADRFRLADPDEPFVDRYLLQFESGHQVESVWHALWSNADWMVGNTILALIPVALAHFAFVRGISPKWLQRVTVAAFVAFLPNALYVATDLIHLVEEGEQLSWSAAVFLLLVPVYALFVATGVTAYAASLLMLHRWLRRRRDRSSAALLIAALHVACSCGIYLGRVVRLNSWQVVTEPVAVAQGVQTMLARPEALAYVVTVALVGACLAWLAAPGARRLLIAGSATAGPSPAPTSTPTY